MHTPLRLDAYLCRPSFTASWCVSPLDTSRTVKVVKFLLTKELMISEIIFLYLAKKWLEMVRKQPLSVANFEYQALLSRVPFSFS